MTQVLIRGEASSALARLSDPSELLNENGEVLGVFTPARLGKLPLFADITEAELQRRRQQPGKWTLPEIWKSLDVAP